MSVKNEILFFFLPWVLLSFLAIEVQNHILSSGDVPYLVYVAKIFFAGGAYGKDIFETNPPMILYLYMPIWIISKITSLEVTTSINLYIFSLTTLSIWVSYYLLKQIIKERFVLFFVSIALMFSVLIIPTYQMGQREHLFLMLTLPYFLLAVLRLENKPVNPWFAVTVGLAAGLGFGIKPYFLFPLVFVELYFMIHTRRWFGWVRIETLIIAAILIIYLLSVFIFQPSYIHVMLPLIHDFYFIGIKEPWVDVLFNDVAIFCWVVFFSYFFWTKSFLGNILMLALGGNLLAWFVTQTTWFYHLIPSLAFACLLLAFCFAQLVTIKRSLFYLLAGLFIFYLPLSYTTYMMVGRIAEKKESSLTQVIQYIGSTPGPRSVLCLSYHTTRDCFSLVFDTHSVYASRSPFCWWCRGVVMLEPMSPLLQEHAQYLMDTIVDDLNQQKARWVIVDTAIYSSVFKKETSFLDVFLKNKNFRDAWKHYHYSITIGSYVIYERNA